MAPATRAAAIASCVAFTVACGSKTTLTTPENDPFVGNDLTGPEPEDSTDVTVGDGPAAGDVDVGMDEPTAPTPDEPRDRQGRSPGGPGRKETPPSSRIPPGQADELCENICSLVAHPCQGAPDVGSCLDQCASMVEGARECPPLRELLYCYEEASFDLDPCQADLGPMLSTACAQSVGEVIAYCPETL